MALKSLNLALAAPADAEATAALIRQLAAESTHVLRFIQVPKYRHVDPIWHVGPEGFCGRPVRSLIFDAHDQVTPAQRERFERTGPIEVRGTVTAKWPSPVEDVHSFALFTDDGDAIVALLHHSGADEVRIRWSWGDPKRFVQRLVAEAEKVWESTGDTPAVAFDPGPGDTSAARAPLVVKEDEPGEFGFKRAQFSVPVGIQLRDYQKEAIRAWVNNGGRGILEMATGTGKTLTALCLACKVAEQNHPLVIIVVCPFLNLATQWIREMKAFGLAPIACFNSREKWERSLQEAYQRISAGLTDYISVVVSNATFLSSAFQSALRPTVGQHLLIADEVHNLGAANLRTVLPPNISLRLGLSATPQRHGDAAGTAAIFDYFGNVVFELGIARAIKEGVLVPYLYHPILVDLTDDEADTYRDLTIRIGRAWSHSADEDQSEVLKMLLIARARLVASAANKLPALSKVVANQDAPITKAIVFCGDGTIEASGSAELERQIVGVSRLLGENHGLKLRKFTCEESAESRDDILTALRNGALDAVVAIRCLDEGIDVPDVRLGFLLASSTNPRQFIQRRGRLLRRAPGKTRAVIYDFLVRPPNFGGDGDAGAFNVERRLFGRELQRVLEFCSSAENGPVALKQLQDLRLQYNLLAH